MIKFLLLLSFFACGAVLVIGIMKVERQLQWEQALDFKEDVVELEVYDFQKNLETQEIIISLNVTNTSYDTEIHGVKTTVKLDYKNGDTESYESDIKRLGQPLFPLETKKIYLSFDIMEVSGAGVEIPVDATVSRTIAGVKPLQQQEVDT